MQDLDEQEKARRRKEEIEFRNKKRYSNLFLFFGSIFQIAISLLIILGLWLLFAFIFFKVIGAKNQYVFQGFTIIIFIGGLLLGFTIYKKLAQYIIEKKNLKEKLTNDVIKHYAKLTKEEQEKLYRR
jgi:hypothetical protein